MDSKYSLPWRKRSGLDYDVVDGFVERTVRTGLSRAK